MNRRNFIKGASMIPFAYSYANSNPIGNFLNTGNIKAKNIIILNQCGAPSHIDLFDPKPKLQKNHGLKITPDIKDEELKTVADPKKLAFVKGIPTLQKAIHGYTKDRATGIEISKLLPHTEKILKDVTLIRSMHTTQFNHAPAQLFSLTGSPLAGRPSLGAWLIYALKSQNKNLPGFVSMVTSAKGPSGGKALWHSGFLPGEYQGVKFNVEGDPVLYTTNPKGITHNVRSGSINLLDSLNQEYYKHALDERTKVETESFKLALKMQKTIPEIANLDSEPSEIKAMYGKGNYAKGCLMARRLIESGVRCVQINHRGWDMHGTKWEESLERGLPLMAGQVDQASAALVKDLKQRGLLDDTIVLFTGEFGRTAVSENREIGKKQKFIGRDHWPDAYSCWIAGGGFKKGVVYGETNGFGTAIAKDPVSVHDLHATILHNFGIDHKKLTFRFQGRDFRLTDVEGHLVKGILA